MKKVKSEEIEVYYGRVVGRDRLQLIGIGDASFKWDDKAVGVVILYLAEQDFERLSLIYWKTKEIERVCHALKETKALIFN